MNNSLPKILYHGSEIKITDGFIRMKPGYINNMKTPIIAAFATSDFVRARLYAIMRLVATGYKSPVKNNELYVECLKQNVPEKAYVYELDSVGFKHDIEDEYYSLTDVKIKNVITIDIMQEIKDKNIKIYVLKDKTVFANMSRKQSDILWDKLIQQQDKFELYKPDFEKLDMAILGKILKDGSKAL